jgi:hypothetical protein
MRGVLILCAGFALTVISSDLLLRSRKIQAALGRVVIVQAIGLVAVVAVLSHSHELGLVSVVIFWSGAVLTWFGLRSHLESSILLRMVHMLRERPMTGPDLIARYRSYYGQAHRIDELQRAGLLTTDQARAAMTPTPKGRLIARLVSRLR